MAVFKETDLVIYKSGATGSCIGGPVYDATAGFVMHSVFNMFSKTERELGKTKFRCLYLKNTHPTITCLNPKVYIPANTENSGTELYVGFDRGSGVGDGVNSGVAPTISDETTTPPNVTFVNGTETASSSALGGDIPPGKMAALWIKCTIAPGTESSPRDGAVLFMEIGNEENNIVETQTPVDTTVVVVGETDENQNTADCITKVKQSGCHQFVCTGNVTNTTDPTSWINLLGILKDRTNICFGFKDAFSVQMKNKIINALTPSNPTIENGYDFKIINNMYQIYMDITKPFINPSPQYDFVLENLKLAKNNSKIDFIIVYCNKAFYATLAENDTAEKIDDRLRRTYHQLFIDYGVHVVISAQFRNYQRHHVLGYNDANTDSPSTFFTDDAPNYVISTGQKYFPAGTGCLFVGCGTGGRRPFHNFASQKGYTANAQQLTSNNSSGFIRLTSTMRKPNQAPKLTGRYYEYYLPTYLVSQYATSKVEVLRDEWSITIQ